MIDEKHTDEKPTNPKHNFGVNKVPLSAVPLPALMELALVMHHGAMKYGRHNYREAGVNASIYFDAAIRHLFAWFEGQNEDPDSGCHPLAHVMACCAIVIDGQYTENLRDDRPPRIADYDVLINFFNAEAKTMMEEGRERGYKFPPPATEVEHQERSGDDEPPAVRRQVHNGGQVVEDAAHGDPTGESGARWEGRLLSEVSEEELRGVVMPEITNALKRTDDPLFQAQYHTMMRAVEAELARRPLIEEVNIGGVFRPALRFSQAAHEAARHPVIDNRKTSQ